VVGAGHVLSAKEHPDGTRTRLKVAVSSDRGRTWRTIAELEDAMTLGKHIPMFQAPTMVSLLRSAPPPRRFPTTATTSHRLHTAMKKLRNRDTNITISQLKVWPLRFRTARQKNGP
jgi:hypothetical protein